MEETVFTFLGIFSLPFWLVMRIGPYLVTSDSSSITNDDQPRMSSKNRSLGSVS